jgi:hypothetical protein
LVQNIGLHDALMRATTLTRAHPVLTDLTRVCTHLGSLVLTPLDRRIERSNPCTLVNHFTSSTRWLDPAYSSWGQVQKAVRATMRVTNLPWVDLLRN